MKEGEENSWFDHARFVCKRREEEYLIDFEQKWKGDGLNYRGEERRRCWRRERNEGRDCLVWWNFWILETLILPCYIFFSFQRRLATRRDYDMKDINWSAHTIWKTHFFSFLFFSFSLFFTIMSRYQLIFYVSKNWIPNLLFNYYKLYQLS